MFLTQHIFIQTVRISEHPMVPDSCCVDGGDKLKCQGNERTDGPPNYGPGKGLESKRYVNDHLHTTVSVNFVKIQESIINVNSMKT